jgi:hypothetical protein
MTPADLAKSGSEHAHQTALFAHIARYCYDNEQQKGYEQLCGNLKKLFAINNAVGRNSAIHGSRNKAEGVKAGVWDLFLPVPIQYKNAGQNVTVCGLFIEMKKPEHRNHANGGLTTEPKGGQVAFGKQVEADGYATAVCYTWEEAFLALLKYLGAL